MVYFLTFLLLTICLLSILSSQWIWDQNQSRRKGLFPTHSKPTMFDVRELIIKGEKEKAVRLYCQIFSVNRWNAQKAVDELERSIQEKNFEV